jgi:hypothetical protein
LRFISTYQSVLVISKYEYRNIYLKKGGQSLSYSILSNDYSIPSNQKSSESYFYILFLFNIIITSFLPATTPAGNHIIPSAIKNALPFITNNSAYNFKSDSNETTGNMAANKYQFPLKK